MRGLLCWQEQWWNRLPKSGLNSDELCLMLGGGEAKGSEMVELNWALITQANVENKLPWNSEMLLFWIITKILHIKIPINIFTHSHLMHWLFSGIFQKILALAHLWWRRARNPHNFLISCTFLSLAALLNTKTFAYAVMESVQQIWHWAWEFHVLQLSLLTLCSGLVAADGWKTRSTCSLQKMQWSGFTRKTHPRRAAGVFALSLMAISLKPSKRLPLTSGGR